jgi:hypothetical protein
VGEGELVVVRTEVSVERTVEGTSVDVAGK